MCVTFVVFTDCESCTRPISTNPGAMEAGEYGVTRWTCLLACRLELDAIAGLLWISWCVLGGADFFSVFFFDFFCFERTRPAASMRSPPASFTSLLVMRPFFAFRQKSLFIMRPFFAFRQKSILIPGCVQGAISSFVCPCLSVCVTFEFRRFY